MDTVYMKERTYRLVQMLRRENQREQRRLEEKLFSKAGMAASHQMELLALAEEQRKVRQELIKIKKSTSSTWGLLPPRMNEPDSDEQLMWELSTKRSKMEQEEKSRHQAQQRQLLKPSFSDSDINFGSLQCHHSDPGVSPAETLAVEPLRHQNVKKRSLQQWDHEKKRTKNTLKKFNVAFPSDNGQVGVLQLRAVDINGTDTRCVEATDKNGKDEVDGAGMGVMPLKKVLLKGSCGTKVRKDNGLGEEETVSSQINPAGDIIPPADRLSSTTVTGIQKENSSLQKQRGSLSSSSSSSGTPKSQENAAKPLCQSSAPLPDGSLQILHVKNNGNENNQSIRKTSTVQLYPITVVDVQEARDNIVRRLGGSHQSSSPKRSLGSAHGFHMLSPIREQKTELSLARTPMPDVVNIEPSQKRQQQTEQVHQAQQVEQSQEAEEMQQGHQSPNKKQKKNGRRKSVVLQENNKPSFDSYRFNPDGTLRMMHQLPDFNASLKEAMKARYLRHTQKQWFERELNVSEIFANDR